MVRHMNVSNVFSIVKFSKWMHSSVENQFSLVFNAFHYKFTTQHSLRTMKHLYQLHVGQCKSSALLTYRRSFSLICIDGFLDYTVFGRLRMSSDILRAGRFDHSLIISPIGFCEIWKISFIWEGIRPHDRLGTSVVSTLCPQVKVDGDEMQNKGRTSMGAGLFAAFTS